VRVIESVMKNDPHYFDLGRRGGPVEPKGLMNSRKGFSTEFSYL
jgi:hypothetical protein